MQNGLWIARKQIEDAQRRIAEHNEAAKRGLVPEIERAHAQALAEQSRAEIIAAGLEPCDVPWCGCRASRVWVRTPAELKKMTRKVKGAIAPVGRLVSCEKHVESWRQTSYAKL